MNDTDINKRMKVVKWARKQGACLIKVGNIELTFPPNLAPRIAPIPRTIQDAAKAEAFIRNPTALDDPDHLSQEQDAWASFTSPPKLG